jgi:hypothetical protein
MDVMGILEGDINHQNDDGSGMDVRLPASRMVCVPGDGMVG